MAETEIVIPPGRIIEHLERHNYATRVNHAPIRTWYQGDCFRLDGANEVSVLLVLSAFVAKARVEGCPVLVGALEVDHRSEEHTSELQSLRHLVCRLLLEKKKYTTTSGDYAPHISFLLAGPLSTGPL